VIPSTHHPNRPQLGSDQLQQSAIVRDRTVLSSNIFLQPYFVAAFRASARNPCDSRRRLYEMRSMLARVCGARNFDGSVLTIRTDARRPRQSAENLLRAGDFRPLAI
jgi:hypothetical protein